MRLWRLPALRAVRKRFPEAEIAIVAPHVADIYRDQEICDQLIPYDPRVCTRDCPAASGWQRTSSAEVRHGFAAAECVRCCMAGLARENSRTNRLCAGTPHLLLTKAVPLPRHGEIPAHEKFYYLELLRRAGLAGFGAGRNFIACAFQREAPECDEFLCESGVRQGALRILSGPAHRMDRRSAGRRRGCRGGKFSLQSEADSDVILFELWRGERLDGHLCRDGAGLPLISQGNGQLPICPRCSRSVISFIGNDSARCTWPRLSACPSSPCLVPPIRREQLPSRRAAASFSKAILQPMFSPQLSDRSPVYDRNHGQHGGGRGTAMAVLDPGPACLSNLRCAPPVSSIAMGRSRRKWAT